jgi:hypothetical protein
LLTGRSESLVVVQKMAEVIETARSHFPPWTWDYLPANTDELEVVLSQWLRAHAGQLQQLGQNIGTVLGALRSWGTGYREAFEARAQPCPEVALTAGTPNFSTLPKGSMERTEKADKIQHSRFTTTMSPVFEAAGLTLRQAQLLEFLFLCPTGQASYRGIAHQYDTSPVNIGRSVGTLLRRGMVRRMGEQAVAVDRAAWRLRIRYSAWDPWLTAEARQKVQECAPSISGEKIRPSLERRREGHRTRQGPV